MGTSLLKNRHPVKALVLVAIGLLATQAFADPDTERLEKLEATISALEKRVAALEGSSPRSDSELKEPKASANWEDRSNWRLLRTGMSKKKVELILGEPQKIDVSGPFENWRWNPPVGPKVTFYDGKLYAWDER